MTPRYDSDHPFCCLGWSNVKDEEEVMLGYDESYPIEREDARIKGVLVTDMSFLSGSR